MKKDNELVEKYQTPDTQITIQKEVLGNKLKLSTTIRIPKIVKDTEVMPWTTDRDAWLKKEVEKPFTIKEEKKGYEIPLTREFYVYQPLQTLDEPLAEHAEMEKENQQLLESLGLNLRYETV